MSIKELFNYLPNKALGFAKVVFCFLIITFVAVLLSLLFQILDLGRVFEVTKLATDLFLAFSLVLVTILGFLFATYSIKSSYEKYLNLTVTTKREGSFIHIITKIENNTELEKELSFAFLIISRQNENPIGVVNTLFRKKFSCTNEFNVLKDENYNIIENENAIFIPLSFYHSENIAIGDESPTYSHVIDCNNTVLRDNIYTVRFYVFPKEGYHRSTCASFVV